MFGVALVGERHGVQSDEHFEILHIDHLVQSRHFALCSKLLCRTAVHRNLDEPVELWI